MTDTPASATLRAELTRRLAAYLPAADVAPAADAAVVAMQAQTAAAPDAPDALSAIANAALAALPEPYRSGASIAITIVHGVQAWLDAPVQVQAGSVTIRDERG